MTADRITVISGAIESAKDRYIAGDELAWDLCPSPDGNGDQSWTAIVKHELLPEIARLQQAYEELEQVGMPLNKFEALCASVAAEARSAALEEATQICHDHAKYHLDTAHEIQNNKGPQSMIDRNLWQSDDARIMATEIRALSIPSVPTKPQE